MISHKTFCNHNNNNKFIKILIISVNLIPKLKDSSVKNVSIKEYNCYCIRIDLRLKDSFKHEIQNN